MGGPFFYSPNSFLFSKRYHDPQITIVDQNNLRYKNESGQLSPKMKVDKAAS